MTGPEKRGTILNVDDHEAARYARTRILTGAGFHVQEAGTAQEALELIATYRPDLVMLDVYLPDANGIEICRYLKARFESTSPIVVQISASATSAPHAISSLNSGADAYLSEPIDPEVLVATVRAMFRLHLAEHNLASANQELAHLNEDLRRSNEDLQQFAFIASHDLREPLRMINVYTQLLLKSFGHITDSKAAQYAGFIQDGVQRMENLIENVLSYSHAIHDGAEKKGTADLRKCLGQAVAVLEERIQEKKAIITKDELPVLPGDEEQLTQVLQNLLSNALRYQNGSEFARVHVGCQSRGTDWVISVRDNGIGFESQYAESIFGLGKRLHREEFPGTGLGLAICKRIIDRHFGRIWAESEPDVGSTFYFLLPSR